MNRLAAAVLALILIAPAVARAAVPVAGPVVGAPAPDFALTTTDGRRVTLADYRGRTLVINVWGSWCPPCRLETPDLIAEAQAQAKNGVAFLGIDSTETVNVVRAFVAAKGVPYPQVVATSDAPFARAYDIRNYPTTFVIDPSGVLRALHADNLLPRAQLQAYIAAARHGETAPLNTVFQQQLDALLDPARYPLTGDPATIVANVRAATAAIGKADDLQDEAMEDPARDHDLHKTRQEQATLRDAAVAALAPVVQSDADRALLARLRGDQAVATGDWNGADAAYAAALLLDPKDRAALSGRQYAATKRDDKALAAQLAIQLTTLDPTAPTFIGVATAQADLGKKTETLAAIDQAVALSHDAARLAWTHLHGGRLALVVGDSGRAQREFAEAQRAAESVPQADSRYTWYLEQSQEALIALGVSGDAKPALSLVGWTGPDLPGSLASTLKYRLAVTGTAGTRVTLKASGLPHRWIASFCTDRVCAPFMTSVVMPANRVKIIEFQVIPNVEHPRAQSLAVRIDATASGHVVATTQTLVAIH